MEGKDVASRPPVVAVHPGWREKKKEGARRDQTRRDETRRGGGWRKECSASRRVLGCDMMRMWV